MMACRRASIPWREPFGASSRVLSIVHPVILRAPPGVLLLRRKTLGDTMRRTSKLLISLCLMAAALTGWGGAPVGGHRGYYGPRVALVAPAPVVVVRP